MEVTRKTRPEETGGETEDRGLERKAKGHGGGEPETTKKDKAEERRRGGEKERVREERGGSSRSCGLPVTDLDNAFIMGKGGQRKGLIHRRVRES